jgi:hypothetical protein
MLSCPASNPTVEKATIPLANSSIKLGWILLNKKLVSPTQLEAVLCQQRQGRQKLGRLLVEAKLISDQQLAQLLQEQYWRKNGYWVS